MRGPLSFHQSHFITTPPDRCAHRLLLPSIFSHPFFLSAACTQKHKTVQYIQYVLKRQHCAVVQGGGEGVGSVLQYPSTQGHLSAAICLTQCLEQKTVEDNYHCTFSSVVSIWTEKSRWALRTLCEWARGGWGQHRGRKRERRKCWLPERRLAYLRCSFCGLFCCRSMLSKAFAWTGLLLSSAAAAPEPSAVGRRQTGRASV